MPAPEVDVSLDLARRLIESQHPELMADVGLWTVHAVLEDR